MEEWPIDGISYAEAQRILNRSISYISARVLDGTLSRGPRYKKATLSRAEVERLALKYWRPRRHIAGGYWCTRSEAAHLLGVSESWISQLSAQDRLPVLYPRTRHLLFRREQIAVIGKTWTARAATRRVEGANRSFVVRVLGSDAAMGIEALRYRSDPSTT